MVTIHVSSTTPINPPGAHPALTPAQAWSGLELKAREPAAFVPVVDTFEIVREEGNRLECVVTFKPGVAHARVIRNACTLHAPSRLEYEMEDGSSAVNVVSEGEEAGALYLTFCFHWVHGELETADGEEGRRLKRQYQETANMTVAATVETMRKLVRVGRL